MAKTTVEGTVSRLNQSGNGFGLKEQREHQGRTYTTYWSVFPPRDQNAGVNVGDRVKVDGFLRTKVSEKDARYVDHTVNEARVEAVKGSGNSPQNSAAPVEEPWATPSADDAGSVPF